jgi:hypothetical protein
MYTISNPRAGAVLAVDVWYGPVPVVHKGILTERGTVIHRSKRIGRAVEESVAAFSEGRPVRVVRPAPRDGQAVVWRARQALGTKWRLFDANCEHLVATSLGRRASSPQLQLAGVLTTMMLALAATRR